MKGFVLNQAMNVEEQAVGSGLRYPVVVKAQVQIGGRGKAGGIQFANSIEQVKEHVNRLLGSVLKGYKVNDLLVVEQSRHETEWYLSIILDRLSKYPLIMFSDLGGVDIEETAKKFPERIKTLSVNPMIGIQDYMARYLLSGCSLSLDFLPQLDGILKKLYQVFVRYDALVTEINPLVVDEGNQLIALDGKVEVDDSALYRLPDIQAYRESMAEEDFVKESRKYDFLYIPIQSGGSIGVVSNGSGMLMSCIDMITKESMDVGAALDLGGGATSERISEAMRIMFSTPGVKAVLINIFGGITRCDEVAEGVKLAIERHGLQEKLVVIRMEGTNKEIGVDIIRGLSGNVILVPGLRESIRALIERRDHL